MARIASGVRIVITPISGALTSGPKKDDAASAAITADFLRPSKAPTHGDDRLRVMGTEGYVEVRSGKCRICTNGEEEREARLEPISREQMGRDILACALGEKDILPWKDTFRITEVCLKAREAADQRQKVSLR